MKKILGIVVLSLVFYVNPLTIRDSNAWWFSDPLEKCMDRVEKSGIDSRFAAKACAGSTKATLKCMDRVEATGIDPRFAAKSCTGN